MKYFAYGSNMYPSEIEKYGYGHQFIGVACLYNYRLAFTRRSIKTNSGVADVVACSDTVVWGVLYEIDEELLFEIDRKEGYGTAYTRILVQVEVGPDSHEAITYTVLKKEVVEVPPSEEYLNKLIVGAKTNNLPFRYIQFLEALKGKSDADFRVGYLVMGTRSRKGAHGMNLTVVSPKLKQQLPKHNLCVVSYNGRQCITRLAYDELLDDKTCRLDQNVRHALGIRGRDNYGAFIKLSTMSNRALLSLIQPRTLTLPLHRPSVLDSEKQISVLHPRNIALLGIQEGDYLVIKVVTNDKNGKHGIRQITRRVFAGTTSTIQRDDQPFEYPAPDEFYLDLSGRTELGIGRDEVETPILLVPNVYKLFTNRLLYYGATLFLGLLALPPLILEITTYFGLSSIIGVSIGFVVSALVTVVFTVLDIRSRTQY